MKGFSIKGFIIACSLLPAAACFCQPANQEQSTASQKSTLSATLAAYESSNENAAAVNELKKILADKNLNTEDRLAVQTTLVHKLQEQKKWDTCLQYCQQQVALAQQQNNQLAAATFYKLIGNTYYNIPEKDRAVEYWKKSIAISETNHNSLLLEQCYHNVGAVILESENNLDEAELNFQKAIQLSIANKTDTTQLGNLHYRLLATLYRVTKRYAKADSLYTTVIVKARQLNDSLRIAEALMFYSVLLADEKNFDKAITTGKEALLIAQQFKKLDMEQTALELLSNNYYTAGNYKEAFYYQGLLSSNIKSRFNTDLNTKISEAEAKFKNAELQHEKELTIVKAKKEKQIYSIGFISLLSIAGMIFYAVYQKRNVKQQLQLQQQVQQEKERLSRDLHDNLGSQMALLSNNVESLDVNFKKNVGIEEYIERVKGTSRQLLQTLRETIWILNKEQVTAQDFFDKLVDYAHRYLQSYPGIQLKVEEDFSGNKVLNSNEALQLFRICQEAVTNSCKYAQSEILLLRGNEVKETFTITIKDSGKGFNSNTADAEGHYGLKNMQQRAAAISAVLKITAAPGQGVDVMISI